jgi:hypothetical protein
MKSADFGHPQGQSECHMSDHALGRGGANLQVTAVDHVLGTHRLRRFVGTR